MGSSSKVLVLNADYTALTVCSVPKAFLLVFLKKADLISEASGKALRSVNSSYPMPSIIKLHSYINMPFKGSVVLSRQNIFKRDGHSCQYCGSKKDLTLDHVLPRSRGGKTSWDNLTTACKSCNSRKGDLTPAEAQMPLHQPPFKPSFVMFLRDFNGQVNEDWLVYLGTKRSA